eukprot:3453869-Amphidinium_carterae.1
MKGREGVPFWVRLDNRHVSVQHVAQIVAIQGKATAFPVVLKCVSVLLKFPQRRIAWDCFASL